MVCIDGCTSALVGHQGLVRAEDLRKSHDTCKTGNRQFFFFALCCLGKIPGGAPFSQLHKGGNGSRVDRP